jgi:voltage-gated potassium channel
VPEVGGGKRLIRTLERRQLTPRRAAGIIATYTIFVTVAGGVVAWLVDRKDFHTLGAGVWWALQTVTTVGYGDEVPRGTVGRLIGAVIMVTGIGFLTVITASVTAALIETARRRRAGGLSGPELGAQLDEVNARLSAIEERLAARRDAPGTRP